MRLTMLTFFLIALYYPTASAQQPVTITSDPRDLSRPISTLIDEMRGREHIGITYEDPRYAYSADVEDVTLKISRSPSSSQASAHRTIVPKGKSITFVYRSDDFQSDESAQATIRRMLREYQTLGGPTFKVIRDGKRFHVLPLAAKDATGTSSPQESILETVITVPAAPRDGVELLQSVCDEIKKKTGFEIGIGPSAPINPLSEIRTNEAISHMTARSALEHVLDKVAAQGTFVWDLFYDPGDKTYGLNFTFVGPVAALASQ